MKEFSAKTTINAPPETIWNILTDAEGYPTWDPGMIRLAGKVAPGETITAYTKASPNRAFPIKVTEFTPSKKMIWASGMPLGLFKGVRTFTLSEQAEGGTVVAVVEQFTGLLLPLIGRTLPDLSQTFAEFLAGLKAHAET